MTDGGAGDVARALADAMAEQRLRIVASLIRTTGDWDLAEDAVSDAAERALVTWPRDGVPDNPAAWLTATARRRAIDVLRRAQVERGKLADLAALEELTEAGSDPSPMGDDRLRLIFTCCHPALALEARVALTLKVVSGLPTEAIGRAFLTSEATMGQRLLRAKQKIAHAGIPYRVPTDDLPDTRRRSAGGRLPGLHGGLRDRRPVPRGRGDPARPAPGRAHARIPTRRARCSP